MNTLRDWLAQKKLLVSDGAWGTELQARGLAPGDCPEAWNVERPDDVRAVAAAYVEAGADLILTNTFGGNELTLAAHGHTAGKVRQFNPAGVRLSLEAAGGAALVAASMGPTGALVEPYGERTVAELEAVFERQAEALSDGGARIVCVETMSAIEEAAAAVRAARRADPGMEVMATMTFNPGPTGYRTMMGVDCRQAAEALAEAGADVIGANCGNGVERMVAVAAALRAASGLPILIHANAGLPEVVGGRTLYRETPATMAEHVGALVEAGANIIGGCCGTTPAHIAALRQTIDALLASRR